MAAVLQVYQYIQVTKNIKILYFGSHIKHSHLEVYIDADWVSDKETRKSISAYIAILADCSISWFSKT